MKFKEELELTHFKLNKPMSYVHESHDDISLISKTNFEEKFFESKDFIKTWRSDPNKRKYSSIDFNPDGCPPDIYNLFTGFDVEQYKIKHDCSEDVQFVLDHLKLLSGNIEETFQYNEMWFSQLFQPLLQFRMFFFLIYGAAWKFRERILPDWAGGPV